MERLTKTYSDGTHGASDSLPCGENSYNYKNLLIEKLGKYEDAEEQGLLFRLPCKVGTKVYAINRIVEYGEVGDVATYSYYINEREFQIYMMMDYEKLVFGKTVFLTQAEAEVKLKELRGGEND